MIIGFSSSSVKGALVPSSEMHFESDFFLIRIAWCDFFFVD
jgi:hypothetical protein